MFLHLEPLSNPKLSLIRESRRRYTIEKQAEQKLEPSPVILTKTDISNQSKPITEAEFEGIMNSLELNIEPKSKIGTNIAIECSFIFDTASVVGLSGGADSIALTILLHEYCKKRGIVLHTATVDHQLRAEAKTEAELVHEWMTKLGIEHRVLQLKWQNARPQTQIQELARQHRYELLHNVCEYVPISSCALDLFFNLADHCSELGARHLFTAHHANDQVETFLLRLAHYSNSDGLAGMYRIKKFMDITVVRPLLSLGKVSNQGSN